MKKLKNLVDDQIKTDPICIINLNGVVSPPTRLKEALKLAKLAGTCLVQISDNTALMTNDVGVRTIKPKGNRKERVKIFNVTCNAPEHKILDIANKCNKVLRLKDLVRLQIRLDPLNIRSANQCHNALTNVINNLMLTNSQKYAASYRITNLGSRLSTIIRKTEQFF